jgi:hypothetical protein
MKTIEGTTLGDTKAQLAHCKAMKQALTKTSINLGDDEDYI